MIFKADLSNIEDIMLTTPHCCLADCEEVQSAYLGLMGCMLRSSPKLMMGYFKRIETIFHLF